MCSQLPKLLHSMAGMPLLEHLIGSLKIAGCEDIVVVTGHQGDAIEAAFSDPAIRFARQDPPRGTGDAVKVALEQQPPRSDTVLLVNGDLPLVTPETIGEMLEAYQRDSASLTLLAQEVSDPHGYGRIILDASGVLSQIVEEQDASEEEKQIRHVNGGMYLFDCTALKPALDRWWQEENRRLASSPGKPGEIYFPPVIQRMMAGGHEVRCWQLPRERADELQQVNDRVQLAAASRIASDREILRLQLSGVTVVDPASTWIEVDVELGPDTIVHPFTVIRRGVVAGARCELGPYAHLREKTRLGDEVKIGNFTEVKNSTFGDHSKAKHLSYIGDGTIGKKVNIGAGTVLANYDGQNKSATSIGDGAFIGSGTIVVAPADIGAAAVTGAGAVVTRGQQVEVGSTVVGIPARPLEK